MNVIIPLTLSIFVPALDREVEVDCSGVTSEQVLAMLSHGLKQKLTDSAAGKPDQAEALVAKRLETVWSLSSNRGPKADPVMVEIRKLVLENADKLKIQKKAVPAKIAEFKTWFEGTTFGGTPEASNKIYNALVAKASSIVSTRGEELDLA